MARLQLVLWILIMMVATVSAQAPDTLWTRTFGGDDVEYPGWIEPAHDSGFVIAGRTRSFGAVNDDMYIIKLNPDGDTVWAHTYGGEDTDWANDIKRTRDGCYIVAGWSNSFSSTGSKFELMKITASGEFLWRHDYGPDTSANYGFGVCQMLDGGFLLVGDVYCHTIYGYDWDVYVIKTDENGTLLNEYQIVKGNSQHSFRAIATQDSGAIMVRGTGSFGMAKFNASGDTAWTRSYGSGATCNSIIQLADGGYAAFGYRDMGYGISDQFWLMRLNSAGDSLWSRYYGGLDPDEGYCVQETYDHGFIMVGQMYPENQPFDISIVRADSSGNLLWSKHIGGQYEDYGWAVQCTPDNGYIILGRTRTIGGSDYDLYVIRLGPDTLIYSGVNQENNLIPNAITLGQNYPNPFNARTVIEYSLSSQSFVTIEIFDILGDKIVTLAEGIKPAGNHQAIWDASVQASGIYFYSIKVGDKVETKRMLLLK